MRFFTSTGQKYVEIRAEPPRCGGLARRSTPGFFFVGSKRSLIRSPGQREARGRQILSGMLRALTGSGLTLFDNRKAGKSTPIIPT